MRFLWSALLVAILWVFGVEPVLSFLDAADARLKQEWNSAVSKRHGSSYGGTNGR